MMVLVIDDDRNSSETVRILLEALGHRVVIAGDPLEFDQAMLAHKFGAVISDMDLGTNKTGIDLLGIVAKDQPEANRILMSGGRKPEMDPQICFLAKPHQMGLSNFKEALTPESVRDKVV